MKTPGGGGETMAVAEIQGLYGAFSFPEKLLQQIWLRGDFDARELRTADGHDVQIINPGRWNLLGGPDFTGARLRIDGVVTTGDVELHLRAADWRAHGHASDPAYDKVVLHVALFPCADRCSFGAQGREIPLLILLPRLHHDLEEYAADAAVERMANHPLTRAHEALAAMNEAALRDTLNRFSQERWAQKIRYAKIRIERLGWNEACHQTALEILGYRANRAPMLTIATRYPLAAWREFSAEESAKSAWFDAMVSSADGGLRWHHQGVRPANHPRTRLLQYARWIGACPEWPETLRDLAAAIAGSARSGFAEDVTCGAFRRSHSLRGNRERFAEEIVGGAVGGSRLDTLICDGFLPLLAAREEADARLLGAWWRHWFAGDVPARWLALLRGLGVIGTRDWPASHGAVQGLLGWLLAEEKKQDFGDSGAGRGT